MGDGSWLIPLIQLDEPNRSVLVEIGPSIGRPLMEAVAASLANAEPAVASEWLEATPERSVALAPVRESALRKLLASAELGERHEDVGRHAHDLAAHILTAHGPLRESLDLAERSIEAYSKLATPTSGPLGLILAISLKAEVVERLGNPADALPGARRAVQVLRGWHANPTIGEYARGVHFISALRVLANCERHVLPQQALAVAREAVTRARDLANKEALAVALTTLGSIYDDLDQHTEATNSVMEAAGLLDDLASERSDAFAVQQAQVALSLVRHLVHSGREREAEVASEKAVTLFRPLFEAWPERYGETLASALDNRALVLLRLRRGGEAEALSREGLEVIRAAKPGVLRLVGCLQNAAAVAAEVGDRARAQLLLREAVEALKSEKSLTEEGKRVLASALVNLSGVASPADALAAADEAVTLLETFDLAVDKAAELALARARVNRSVLRDAIGDRDGATRDVEQAVVALRAAYHRSSTAYASDLAMTLSGLGIRLRRTARSQEAIQLSKEAVEIARKEAEREPANVSLLARMLVNLAGRLADERQYEASLEHLNEVFKHIGRVEPNHPDGEALAAATFNYSIDAGALERLDEAADAARVAWLIRIQRLPSHPEEVEVTRNCFFNLLDRYNAAGRKEEAENLRSLWREASGQLPQLELSPPTENDET